MRPGRRAGGQLAAAAPTKDPERRPALAARASPDTIVHVAHCTVSTICADRTVVHAQIVRCMYIYIYIYILYII